MSAIDLVEKSQLTDRPRMKSGDTVRVAGIRVGTVDSVSLRPDKKVMVKFDADNNVVRDASNNPVLVQITSLERYRRTLLFQKLGYPVATIQALGGGWSTADLPSTKEVTERRDPGPPRR